MEPGDATDIPFADLPEQSVEIMAWQAKAVPHVVSQAFPSPARLQLRDRALAQVLDMILAGELKPGSLASEKQVAKSVSERLGQEMSRTPVREALAVLAHDGFVRNFPQRGFKVLEISSPEVLEALSLCSEVEGVAIERLAATDAASSRFDVLVEAQDDLAQAAKLADISLLALAETKFHVGLAVCAGLKDAPRSIARWRQKVHLYGAMHMQPFDFSMAWQEHEEVMLGINAGRANVALEAADRHMETTLDRLGLSTDARVEVAPLQAIEVPVSPDPDASEAPSALVSTEWVAAHLDDRQMKVVEVDGDATAYAQGHIPGAIGFDWTTQLQQQERRDVLSGDQLETLLGEAGISNDHTVVLYGDNDNWFAAYAFWLLEMYGHKDVKLMDGGRRKWEREGRPLIKDTSQPARASYKARAQNVTLRVRRDEVLGAIHSKQHALLDVRTPAEYHGRIMAPPGLAEGAQRAGHIPGAANVPWDHAVSKDGTFKVAPELEKLYARSGITRDKDVIAYCRIGERSSHTWFALKHLLGYPRVRNYDGSWTEYGSLVDVPIDKEP